MKVLHEMQKWRRGEYPYDDNGVKGLPLEPGEFGKAIDVAIVELQKTIKQLKQTNAMTKWLTNKEAQELVQDIIFSAKWYDEDTDWYDEFDHCGGTGYYMTTAYYRARVETVISGIKVGLFCELTGYEDDDFELKEIIDIYPIDMTDEADALTDDLIANDDLFEQLDEAFAEYYRKREKREKKVS